MTGTMRTCSKVARDSIQVLRPKLERSQSAYTPQASKRTFDVLAASVPEDIKAQVYKDSLDWDPKSNTLPPLGSMKGMGLYRRSANCDAEIDVARFQTEAVPREFIRQRLNVAEAEWTGEGIFDFHPAARGRLSFSSTASSRSTTPAPYKPVLYEYTFRDQSGKMSNGDISFQWGFPDSAPCTAPGSRAPSIGSGIYAKGHGSAVSTGSSFSSDFSVSIQASPFAPSRLRTSSNETSQHASSAEPDAGHFIQDFRRQLSMHKDNKRNDDAVIESSYEDFAESPDVHKNRHANLRRWQMLHERITSTPLRPAAPTDSSISRTDTVIRRESKPSSRTSIRGRNVSRRTTSRNLSGTKRGHLAVMQSQHMAKEATFVDDKKYWSPESLEALGEEEMKKLARFSSQDSTLPNGNGSASPETSPRAPDESLRLGKPEFDTPVKGRQRSSTAIRLERDQINQDTLGSSGSNRKTTATNYCDRRTPNITARVAVK